MAFGWGLSRYGYVTDRTGEEIEEGGDQWRGTPNGVTAEFVENLPAGSPAYDAERTNRYGSGDRLSGDPA